MIDRRALLSDLQRLLRLLEGDLRQRCEVPEIGAAVQAEYEAARKAQRTAQTLEEWRADYLTQVAAAWILSCVFARFLEDNLLVDPPRLSGPGQRLQRARDEYDLYVHQYPAHTVREYLLDVFDRLAHLPGARDVFGQHNLVQSARGWLSGDAAKELLNFWQKIDPASGRLLHDFTDPAWDTRFLGDLYQDLSEAARKKYALLQTPDFVEAFILDRTLEPALEEFGLEAPAVLDRDGNPLSSPGFRLIDPACGSGHFLLGAFPRILQRWQRKSPGANQRELVQRTLDSIYGVDVNPFAVAIARFRLLLSAMRACDVTRLRDAPAFDLHIACGDSLLHAPLRGGQLAFDYELSADSPGGEAAECEHAYQSEDLPTLKRILRGGQYHAVVANPPYITPKDRQLNQWYRRRFESCHRQYSLAVPFLERIFQLAVSASKNSAGGYTGQITANSFMKREFGKKLIESFLPQIDLTHVIDTSGAYIPGHGTPTVILFGRDRSPVASSIRAVMGIRGEPATPEDPAQGLVWSAIVGQLDQPGSHSAYVSVSDAERERFHTHPWSIGGGGAAELKEFLDESATTSLSHVVTSIGFYQDTHADEAFVQPIGFSRRRSIQFGFRRQIRGDNVRDWGTTSFEEILFPYNDDLTQWADIPRSSNWSWLHSLRTELWSRSTFGGGTYKDNKRPWYDFHQFPKDRARTPLSIVFAFVATHNHFVLDRGGKVFNRSAPVIKLPPEATEDDHLALLGLLNSSTACFWMKQIFHDKGSTVDAHGARQTTVAFENFREFTGTGLLKFPLSKEAPVDVTRRLQEQSQELQGSSPATILTAGQLAEDSSHSAGEVLANAHAHRNETLVTMIFLQEELDWECYQLYGLTDEDLTYPGEAVPLKLGERAFEIVLARKVAAGEVQTTWFARHGSTPITELPAHWPDDYRALVQRRIEVIESNPQIALIEQPEYKRRWNTEPWEEQVERALREWLLDRLESYFDFDGRMNEAGEPTARLEIALVSVPRLADLAQADPQWMEVAELYRDRDDFDVLSLVGELVADESVPLLPVLRYKPAGLDKRSAWERTWQLQRAEDAIDARVGLDRPEGLTAEAAEQLKRETIGQIPVPPKYKSSDFRSAPYWRLRGKLDVPKERWVSFPHCEGADQTPVIAWAGYDHLQLAGAIAAYFAEVQQTGGSEDPRLVPLLSCLQELVPWLQQWHNEIDPHYGYALGDYFATFVAEEARTLGKTKEDIQAWTPPAKSGRGKRRPKKTPRATDSTNSAE